MTVPMGPYQKVQVSISFTSSQGQCPPNQHGALSRIQIRMGSGTIP
ncbi:hypothetical protein SAMN05444580_11078 [Rhodococcus tukisamuensis]|uniref:Uncharacterized protein n=1 Tax=Rhodococcus tukisamuensis TaxID=168276 RepID=A0A1G7A7L6_9NOCA|nr:hypothetical protein SAMN05444580_11078 [Rhodococcus tukisamuensis]